MIARDVQTAVRFVLPDKMARYAVTKGTIAVNRYYS